MSDTQVTDAKDQRIGELENELVQVYERIEALKAQIKQLQAEMEKQKRAGKRQATSFSRQKKAEQPKHQEGKQAKENSTTKKNPLQKMLMK